MANIEKYTEGALAKTKKANEVIEKVNSLLNMRFEEVGEEEDPEIEYSENNVVLRIPPVPKTNSILICDSNTLKQADVYMKGEPTAV